MRPAGAFSNFLELKSPRSSVPDNTGNQVRRNHQVDGWPQIVSKTYMPVLNVDNRPARSTHLLVQLLTKK
jgi:hypothetical protein